MRTRRERPAASCSILAHSSGSSSRHQTGSRCLLGPSTLAAPVSLLLHQRSRRHHLEEDAHPTWKPSGKRGGDSDSHGRSRRCGSRWHVCTRLRKSGRVEWLDAICSSVVTMPLMVIQLDPLMDLPLVPRRFWWEQNDSLRRGTPQHEGIRLRDPGSEQRAPRPDRMAADGSQLHHGRNLLP